MNNGLNRVPTPEEISSRAYSLYEKEGRVEGRDQEHWYRAEQELAAFRHEQRPSSDVASELIDPIPQKEKDRKAQANVSSQNSSQKDSSAPKTAPSSKTVAKAMGK